MGGEQRGGGVGAALPPPRRSGPFCAPAAAARRVAAPAPRPGSRRRPRGLVAAPFVSLFPSRAPRTASFPLANDRRRR